MATGRPERHGCLFFGLSVCSVVAFSTTGRAEVEFSARISAGVARTDNIALVETGAEAETVYQLMPSFELEQQSARVTSRLVYRMDAFRYDSLGEQEIYNSFSGRTTLALDPDNFFFDLGASRAQSIRNPLLEIPRGNLPLSDNRIDRDESFAGPWFQYTVGRDVTISGSYRRSWVRYDDTELDQLDFTTRDADSDEISFSIDNYRRESGAAWAFRYTFLATDYHIVQPWKQQQAVAELGVWAGRGVRLFASAGMESPWEEPLESSLEDTMWEVGLSKTAGERFSMELAAGERSFGSTWRGRLEMVFRTGRTSVSYAEESTTQERNPYLSGGLFDPFQLDDLLTEAGLAQVYISRRLQWDTAFNLPRTQIGVALLDESREQRLLLEGTSLPDYDQSGGVVRATRRFGARTGVHFVAGRFKRSFQAGDEFDLTEFTLGASYSLGSRTELTLDLTRTEDEPRSDAVGPGYKVDTASLLLTRTF